MTHIYSHYCWGEPSEYDRHRLGAVLSATAPDDAIINLHLDARDGHVRPMIGVWLDDGTTVSTDNAQDWPALERYLPRHEWPEEIYVGARGPSQRRPDPAIRQAVAAYAAKLAQDLADTMEDER